MQLKSIADTAAGVAGEPGAFVSALNDGLARLVVSEAFATAVHVVVSPADGEVGLANAGHPAPLLCKGKGGPIEELESAGMPLGILEGQDYAEETAAFEPGDTLVVFTDGVTEVRGRDGELLGTPGLIGLIEEERSGRPERFLERIYERVKAHCAEVALADDFTILSVRREG
jgi:sigma-B regulation protein RsbU (phosphoserine phosphatase)